jgi:hypothetical protein
MLIKTTIVLTDFFFEKAKEVLLKKKGAQGVLIHKN